MLSMIWDCAGTFLIVLTLLVFVHELGHYWIARINGVRVEVFSVGFGPELWGRNDSHGTRWKFSLIPIGGYVKFFGEAAEGATVEETLAQMSPADRAVAFHSKRVGQRAAVVAAGPIANFLLAFVLLVGLFMTVGQPYSPAQISIVVEGSAAEEAGFQPGDLIVRVGDTEIERFEELVALISLSGGETLDIAVIRDGEELVLPVTPKTVEEEDIFGNPQVRGKLGVGREGAEYRRLGPLNASWQAVEQIGSIVGITASALGEMIVGSRPASELGGPVRIAQMSCTIGEIGLVAAIWFAIMLSINLGLINLFPIPVLDGGHLAFCAVEWVRGRPVTERVQDFSFRIGLALVLMLMIFATWNDLVQLQFFEFVGGLFS
jgi:regulator of sigma E protease